MPNSKPVVKLDSKIASATLVDKKEVVSSPKFLQQVNEHVKRPEILEGRTYKLKPPNLDHALYLTINNIVLNRDTEHESWQPFEVFINSKDMESYQWIVALTRLVSAVFRKGGDVIFMIEELKSVFDPNGGYFSGKRQGRVPSLVAEIGMVIEEHFKWLGLIEQEELSEEAKEFVEQKSAQYVARGGSMDKAQECPKCFQKTLVRLDNCLTCLNCADSKCG